MKRTDYLLIFLYTVLILAVIIHSIFGLFDFQWTYLLEDLSKLRGRGLCPTSFSTPPAPGPTPRSLAHFRHTRTTLRT